MKALAFSNNDIAVVAWTYDRRLAGCLGFAIFRRDVAAGTEEALPALARFAAVPTTTHQTTAEAPVQKFWWKDLGAKRDTQLQYRIVPMGGTPGTLAPLAGADPLLTNIVVVTHARAPFEVYFNRGIVASQALTHQLGTPDVNRLRALIADPANPIRQRLEGELYAGLTSLLDRADQHGGTIQAALYELNDSAGLEVRLQAADHGDPHARTVILGNEFTTDPVTNAADDDADRANRAALHNAGVSVIDRMLPKGQIPHNKFMVLFLDGQPHTVLSGSTNWTTTGLATQTNNTLIVESPAVAGVYAEYWQQLQSDVVQSGGDRKKLQAPALRTFNRTHNEQTMAQPVQIAGTTASVEILFAPSTKSHLASPPREKPGDMQHVFELVAGAKHAILFLAFDPGNNSILDAAGAALRKNPNLFVRGALTSSVRALKFRDALEGKGEPGPAVAVIGEPGQPTAAPASREPDFRAIPAGHVGPHDAFGAWETELQNAGFAIIHDKIVVIDPFSDDCVVITGSHNLGYRASHNNDENMIIIHGHRPLAEAYACHVLDLYDHYAWRFLLHKFPKTFGRPLDETDKWQDRYIKDADEKSPELRFWLGADAAGHAPG
jgi:phosphatidylserine/phosphatidylglycerophosphate/cardiolipin synthase-like enzyme